MAEQKKKTAVTFTWKYAAGEESIGGFKEAFEAGGGKVVKELFLPFPQVEFQSLPDRDRGARSPTSSTSSSPAAAR